VLVVDLHEGADGRTDLLDVGEDVAVDGLLLEGPVEAFRDAVGLGLLDEGEGRGEAPEADLVEEVVGQVLRAVVHAQRDAASDVAADGPEDILDGHADRLERVETVADLADVPAQAFGVPVLDDREDQRPTRRRP